MEYVEKLRDEVRSIIRKNQLSMTKAAQQMGIHYLSFQKFMRGEHTYMNVLWKIEDWLEDKRIEN